MNNFIESLCLVHVRTLVLLSINYYADKASVCVLILLPIHILVDINSSLVKWCH